MLEALTCRLCGGDLQSKDNGTYMCPHCGHTFVKKTEDDHVKKFKDLLIEEKFKKVSSDLCGDTLPHVQYALSEIYDV